ncbi:hypothetical protein [Hymenobacter convexus]|uniref:hypothetical protein n=1 Tax=Hymenobacter sp. CA1UV-4 TaxID=3063782 RepID=UPI0027131B4F|nr:hypothetical protein [Hymenobacter sp. CA1UV-4]MDO7854429.1 hypothetical protein [Hymenobacter sp. CA1UV-4]
MAIDSDTLHRQWASAIVGPGAMRRVAVKAKCPAALLHTLLALHLRDCVGYLSPSTADLQESLQVSLPLVRGYVRDLEARGCIKRERFYRRGPRLLRLTDKGKELVRQCQQELKRSAALLV